MNDDLRPEFDPTAVPNGYVFPEAVENVSANLKRVIFPGGFSCYTQTSAEETGLIYNEVMVNEEYFRYGLSVTGARCVFDVGANIGLFTLAVKMKVPEATVYAFEAISDTCQTLEKNIEFHGCSNVHAYNVAIGSLDGTEKSFTYYPHMAGNSTTDANLKNEVKPVMDQLFGKEWSNYLYESEKRIARVRTLSAVIQEEGVTRIDYLKIDVEGDEVSVLEGIKESDWPIIKQVVVETHNEQLRKQVGEYLAAHKFKIFGDTGLSSPMGVSNVYALRG